MPNGQGSLIGSHKPKLFRYWPLGQDAGRGVGAKIQLKMLGCFDDFGGTYEQVGCIHQPQDWSIGHHRRTPRWSNRECFRKIDWL